jgi:uncharacterized protein YyaL (SSP411 family)
VTTALRRLEAPRTSRKLPRLDDKVIAGWNGLMIDAYALAGAEFSATEFVERAERAARLVLDHFRDGDGKLLRVWRRGKTSQPAFLEDAGSLGTQTPAETRSAPATTGPRISSTHASSSSTD